MATEERSFEKGLDIATRTGLSVSAKHVTAAVTGSQLAGDVAGQAVGAAYERIPGEVKAGAGAGGLLAIHAATHMAAVGTAGSLAAAGAVIAAAPVVVAVGAAAGLAYWLSKKA